MTHNTLIRIFVWCLNFTVPVTSVTLTPYSTTVIVGHQINLTCTTSYCNPPANITWYKSTTDITSQSTFTRIALNGSVKTTSQLLSRVVKTDNGQDVFCIASNTPSLSVKSMVYTLTVLCKNTLHFLKCIWIKDSEKNKIYKHILQCPEIPSFIYLIYLVKTK